MLKLNHGMYRQGKPARNPAALSDGPAWIQITGVIRKNLFPATAGIVVREVRDGHKTVSGSPIFGNVGIHKNKGTPVRSCPYASGSNATYALRPHIYIDFIILSVGPWHERKKRTSRRETFIISANVILCLKIGLELDNFRSFFEK